MSKRINKIIIFTILISVLITFSSCKVGTGDFFGDSVETEVLHNIDNTVYIPIEKIRTLNPLVSKDEDMYHISKLLYDSLFVLDEKLSAQPLLVKTYEYNEEGTELYITLHDNVKWHDGEIFNAEDVKFTVEAIKKLSYTNETLYADHIANIRSVTVDKDDEFKLTIKFSSKTNSMIENLIFPIIPKHQFRNVSSVNKDSSTFNVIGTGAYKCGQYYEFTELVLTPNEEYFREKAANTLRFQILPDRSYAVNMIDTGEVSLFYSEEPDRNTMIASIELKVTDFASNENEVVGFNLTKEHTSVKKVRQALAYAINSEEILNNIYYGNGIITDTLFLPDYFGSSNRGDVYAYDTYKASLLLIEAGYEDLDGDGYLENVRGNELSLSILVDETNKYRVATAEQIKASFDKLGIYSEIDFCEPEEYLTKLTDGDYDMYLGGFKINDRWDIQPLISGYFNNYVGYNNPEINALIAEMSTGATKNEKKEFVENMKDILIEELPYYNLMFKTYGCFLSDYFTQEVSSEFNNLYAGCKSWYCEYISKPESN